MPRSFAWALVVAGILLLAFGVQASHSISSGLSKLFTGAPADKAIWLFVTGVIATLAGSAGLARR